MNKYRDNEIVFGTKWFEKHQSKLLWLLNTPIIKYWFRWIMRIRSYDCRKDVTIIKITPNSFSAVNIFLEDGTPEIITDFSCHDRYSKRLYNAFKPFWYLFHMIDWVAFDRYEVLTKLSFGFSTLTKYPNSSTSLNGTVNYSTTLNTSWATIHDATDGKSATTNPTTTLTPIGIFSDNITNGWNGIYRGFVLFDTSALTADATISAATLSLYGSDKADTFSPAIAPNINIYTSTPASNTVLATDDFDQVGTTAQCDTPVSYDNYSTTGYNDFAFNATGLGNISKTSISKFGIRNANYDVANTPPTWSSSKLTYMSCRSSDDAGASPAPRLVVTYTLPATGPANLKSYNTNLKANIKTINTNPIANVKTLNTNV